MKLLSVAMPQHDVNMSYYDGNEVHYIKLERLKQEKRFKFSSLPQWKHEAQAIWGVEEGDIDDFICTFDPIALPSHLQKYLPHNLLARIAQDPSNAERLALEVCSYLGVGQAWFSSHHYSHALSTWMLESSPPDVQIVIDGLGDGRPWSVYRNQKLVGAGDIRHGSIGWGIREAGKLLGVKYGHYNDIAGKVMGLQSYGQLNAEYLARLRSFGIGQIKDIWSVAHWHRFQGSAVLGQESLLDWVTTVHQRTGELILELFRQFAAPGEKLSYSGGVAQNVLWNSAIRTHFPHVIIPPHASDEGLSLGGIEWLRKKHGLGAFAAHGFPYIQSDIAVAEPSADTINWVAHLLAQGKVVGWYQGQGEAGPRALGNRSILMDPRLDQGKERINSVKMRENYRPFGASVLKERFGDFFEGHADPFMLYACHLKGDAFPAIRHVDGSCRVQLVDQGNPVFNQLLARFNEITGCPLLLNTSLNLAGKPIAADPAHARQFFDETALDAMCIGDEILCK